jgi:membrane protease YdiL (CAAX protease family)
VRPKSGAGVYFAIALGWSFAFWAAAGFSTGIEKPPGSLLFLIGGAGPLLAALALTHLREARPLQRDFWLRVVDLRRIGWVWLAAALLTHPALVALALVADLALGGAAPPPVAAFEHPLVLLELVFFVFWFGPLPEEMGWRGFALDRLQLRMNALRSSLVLGAVWAIWHVPLFLIPGTFQNGLGFATPRFWVFLATLLPLSVLITWIYNNTRRSTLAAVLVHFSGNLAGALLEKSFRFATFELVCLAMAALAIVLVFGPERLSRQVLVP